MELEQAQALLKLSGFLFDDEDGAMPWTLNLNDVWGWACADGETIPEADLPEVARLFRDYGWCGILYWVSERRQGFVSEFHDNNRFIEFVRHEEAIRREEPRSSRRAYLRRTYTLGAKEGET